MPNGDLLLFTGNKTKTIIIKELFRGIVISAVLKLNFKVNLVYYDGHTMTKSLILCSPNSNPNPK